MDDDDKAEYLPSSLLDEGAFFAPETIIIQLSEECLCGQHDGEWLFNIEMFLLWNVVQSQQSGREKIWKDNKRQWILQAYRIRGPLRRLSRGTKMSFVHELYSDLFGRVCRRSGDEQLCKASSRW